MTDPIRQQAHLDASYAYEALFVPALFGQWTGRVVEAAHIQHGQRVLDVACGTGILAREAHARVSASGRVIGIDPSQGMLAVAKLLAPGIEWRAGVAEALPFADHAFDAVVSQFGLMFFKDRRQALREMQRVLTPTGHLAIAVWDALENIPAYASTVALVQRMAGQRAADAIRAPFALGDRRDLAALFLEATGVAAEITTHQGVAQFPSIRTMVEADLRGWLPMMGVVLGDDEIERILRDAEQALSAHAMPDGRMAFPVSVHVVTTP